MADTAQSGYTAHGTRVLLHSTGTEQNARNNEQHLARMYRANVRHCLQNQNANTKVRAKPIPY